MEKLYNSGITTVRQNSKYKIIIKDQYARKAVKNRINMIPTVKNKGKFLNILNEKKTIS